MVYYYHKKIYNYFINFMLSLKSAIVQKVLTYFFINSSSRHYINELARILDLDPKNLYRKLKEMEGEGLLLSEISGKQKYYFLNNSFLLLEQYKAIFNKTIGIEGLLKKLVGSSNSILRAYIFGSYAKDKMDIHSDIDLLIVGDCSVLEIAEKIAKLEKSIGREINLLNLSFNEYEKRKNKKGDLINNILIDKIINLK